MRRKPSLATIGACIGAMLLASSSSGQPAGEPAARPPAAPVPAPAPELTLDLIMRDANWIGRSPQSPYWADDGQAFYYWQKREDDEQTGSGRDLVRVEVATGTTRVIPDEELGHADVRAGEWSQDYRWKVWSREGDIFLKDATSGQVRQLTRTADVEVDPHFFPDTKRIWYRRGSAILVRDLATGEEAQPADLRAEKDPARKTPEKGFLREQQERLFENVRQAKARRDGARDRERAQHAADATRTPPPWYLGDDVEIRSAVLSPTGRWMLVRLASKEHKEGRQDAMPSYVTDDGYVSTRPVRTKVGTGSHVGEQLVLLDLEAPRPFKPEKDEQDGEAGGKEESKKKTEEPGKFALDLSVLPGITDDPLKELREAAEARKKKAQKKEEGKSEDKKGEHGATGKEGERTEGTGQAKGAAAAAAQPEKKEGAGGGGGEGGGGEPDERRKDAKKKDDAKPRPVVVGDVAWSLDGSRVAIQCFSLDNKDRWIAVIDLETKKVVPLEHMTDSAWINGRFAEMGWLKDNHTLWFLSEETGYSQLYALDVAAPETDTGRRRRLTGPDAVNPRRTTVEGMKPFEGRVVRDVRIDGLNRVPRALVENQILAKAGSPLEKATVEKDIQRLNRLGRFSEIDATVVTPDQTGVVLVYELTETTLVKDVQVVGNRHISDTDLAAEIPPLKGTPLTRFEIDHAKRRIRELYRGKGYDRTDVTVDESESAKTGIVLFRIREEGLVPGGWGTDGHFEVSDVTLSRDGRYLYFTANREHPGVRELYRVATDPAAPITERLTRLGGQNDFALSPDESRILSLHSETNRPPEVYVQETSAGPSPGAPKRMTTTVSPEFESIDWLKPEVVAVPGREDRVIWSRVYDAPKHGQAPPSAGDPGAQHRPAVLFVHGAGYLQDAHLGWSYYFHEFMFHTLLARRGYVVLDMDYRASAGYGRDWRTAIYRCMGEPELEDLEDGVAWLVKERNVDPARIGVYGGSYGGFLTLMAMFDRPGLFACGAALRPVTDWAHYNDPYTANILNTPELDPESYERSSPIEHAAGLAGRLLICHGMLDDNVLYQDTVRLAQKLIELKKENWEVAAYPVESHGFREPASWLDEYRRILRMFEQGLERYPPSRK